jgi:predicted Zn-dependent peptidase
LVHTLREKKKLVWSVSTANYGHEGPGVFSVFAECGSAKRKPLRREVEHIFDALRKRPLPPKELSRAKNIIQNSWLQGFETYHQQASILGLYALDNQLSRLDSYLPRIAALQSHDLQKIAARYLHGESLSSAVITA